MQQKQEEVYKLLKSTSLKCVLNCMEYFNNNLYIGDDKGVISKFQLDKKEKEFLILSQQVQLVKAKIDQIKAQPFGKYLIVQANEQLWLVDSQNFENKKVIIQKYVNSFVLNESNKHINEILVSFKKGNYKLSVVQFDINTSDFQAEKNQINIQETPYTMAFTGNLIYFGNQKKEYQYINLKQGLNCTTLDCLQAPINPLIKVTDKDELFALTVPQNVGVFIGKDGQVKMKSSITEILNKPCLQALSQKPYLLLLYDQILQIYNMIDSRKIQEFQINVKAVNIANNLLFLATNNAQIYLYEEIPYEQRILDCLRLGRIQEAQLIFEQQVTKDDPLFKEKQDKLNVDAGWNLLNQLNFKEAQEKLIKSEFDIRELIALFKGCVPIMMSDKIKQSKTFRTLIEGSGRVEDRTKIEMLEKEAISMGIQILEEKRNRYNVPQLKEKIKDKQKFAYSIFSPNKQEKENELNLQNVLELIDFSLIKLCIDNKRFGQLIDILNSERPIHCKAFFIDLNETITKDQEIVTNYPQIIAAFFAKFDRIHEALEKWKDIGQSDIPKQVELACIETIKILQKCEESKIILDYLIWVLRKNSSHAKSLFQNVSENILSPDIVLSYISERVYSKNEQSQAERLKETYLEILVFERKIEERRFHTQLGIMYIDNLFKFISSDTKTIQAKTTMNSNEQINKGYKQLNKFLKDPNAKYSANVLLEKVKDSWLIQEEIFLYGKEKRHDEALQKLIILKEFEWAEDYCANHQDKLLTKLFNLYLKYLKQLKERANKEGDPDRQKYLELKNNFENNINLFIKKYATHPQLEPLAVLSNIPDDWILSEDSQKNEDGLYSCLTQIISHSLHQRRQTKVAKNLSDMDSQNVICNLIKSKQAYVRITDEKKCIVCHKSIGDKNVCVYPNGVVVDYKCVNNGQSLCICPQTGQDFEKTFRG